jgi:hypothetical protein
MKRKENPNWFRDELSRAQKRFGKVIDSRYYIVEVTPAYNTGGYYDQDIPEQRKMVSGYHPTPQSAWQEMKLMEPDKGNKFELVTQKLYERTVREWH